MAGNSKEPKPCRGHISISWDLRQSLDITALPSGSGLASKRTLVDIGDLDIAGTSVARGQDGEVASLEQAVGDFERELLQRLYASSPSTRQLAGRLQTSHTAIAQRLRKYGIPKANG